MLLLAQMGPSHHGYSKYQTDCQYQYDICYDGNHFGYAHFKRNSTLADQTPTHARSKDPGHRTLITVDNVNEYAQKAAYGSILSLMPHKSSDMMLDISDPQGRAELSSKYTCDGGPL